MSETDQEPEDTSRGDEPTRGEELASGSSAEFAAEPAASEPAASESASREEPAAAPPLEVQVMRPEADGSFEALTPVDTRGLAAGLSTLQDVRAGLLSDVDEERADALRRNLAKAEQRVDLLLGLGHDPALLEGRLAAAQKLHARGESRSSLILVEELLVLAKTMFEHGPLPKSGVPSRTDEAEGSGPQAGSPGPDHADELAELIEHERAVAMESQRRELDAVEIRTEAAFEELRERDLPALRYETRRSQERAIDDLRGDLTSAGRDLLEARLSELLSEERFAVAAARAAASKPGELIDRPEFLARVDAVASRLDSAVLEHAPVREAIDAKVRGVLLRFIRGGDLARAIEPIVAAQAAPDLAEHLSALERQGEQAREQAEAVSGLRDLLEAERARARERDARLAALEERLAVAEQALGEVDVSDQIKRGLSKALSSPGFSKRVGGELERQLAEPPFSGRVEELSRGVVESEFARPERVAALIAAVVAADELVKRVLGSEGLGERLKKERAQTLKLEAFARRVRELIEGAFPNSTALRARVLDLLDDEESGGPVVDQRIDDRILEKTDDLLDQRTLRRRITAAVREELVEDVFRTNVDERVKVLAEEGFLADRIKTLLEEGTGPALDAAMANSEVLRRVVLKEIRNREAIHTAQLTGDGLSDPATAMLRSPAMQQLLEEKVREALSGKKRRPPAPLKGPDKSPKPPPKLKRGPGKGPPPKGPSKGSGGKRRG